MTVAVPVVREVEVQPTYTLVRLEALPIERGGTPITPETVVKRLWAAGAYSVQIGVENGVDVVTLAAKGE